MTDLRCWFGFKMISFEFGCFFFSFLSDSNTFISVEYKFVNHRNEIYARIALATLDLVGFGSIRFWFSWIWICWSYVIVTVCFVKYSMWRIREVENVCSIWNREMWRNQMERIFEVPVLDGTGHAKCRLVISKTKPKWNDVDYNLCVG